MNSIREASNSKIFKILCKFCKLFGIDYVELIKYSEFSPYPKEK